MNKPQVTLEGRRCYVKTDYGDPVVNKLKNNFQLHWDRERKAYWLSSQFHDKVNEIIAKHEADPAASQPTAQDTSTITVVGRAKYKGKTYYIRWVGMTRQQTYKARLCSLNGQIDFWATMAQPHERHHHDGSGDVAVVVASYEQEKTLGSIRRFIEKQKSGQPGSRDDHDRPDRPVRGCSTCQSLGRMCDRCRFDEYDN